MNLTSFDLFVWVATLSGHVALLAVIFVRRRASSFPFFTVLIVASVIRTAALYYILHHLSQREYFNCYWAMAVVDEILQLFVFYELASQVFCPTGTWAKDIRGAFIASIIASVVLAASLTWLASPVTRKPIQTIVLKGTFFSSALMSELFIGILVLSVISGLPWKTHVARISQALGAYSIISVATDASATFFGVSRDTKMYSTLSHVRIVSYLMCLGYWLVALWQNAPEPRTLPETMRLQIYTLQRRLEYDLARLRIRGRK